MFRSLFLLACAASQAAEWTPLFDGKTLNGWHVEAKPEDAAAGYWTVRDGAIVCDSRARPKHDSVWLVSDAEYGDFELELSVRGFPDSRGNSGVQIRSRYDAGTRWMHGPQIDIHPPAPFRTGLIYDETREVRHWISPVKPSWNIEPADATHQVAWKNGEWNTVRIEAQGTRIRTFVNGTAVADYDGKGVLDDDAHRRHNVGLRGHIALQLHSNDDLHMWFKNIRIRTR